MLEQQNITEQAFCYWLADRNLCPIIFHWSNVLPCKLDGNENWRYNNSVNYLGTIESRQSSPDRHYRLFAHLRTPSCPRYRPRRADTTNNSCERSGRERETNPIPLKFCTGRAMIGWPTLFSTHKFPPETRSISRREEGDRRRNTHPVRRRFTNHDWSRRFTRQRVKKIWTDRVDYPRIEDVIRRNVEIYWRFDDRSIPSSGNMRN